MHTMKTIIVYVLERIQEVILLALGFINERRTTYYELKI